MSERVPGGRAAGRPRIALALGGGGARGLAHIGVLRVLEQEGVETDLLAGTSMGGLIACLYAAGMRAAMLEAEVLRMASVRRLFSLADATLVRRGLFRGQHVTDYLRGLLGEAQFSDLDLPAAVVAVDVRAKREVVISDGDVVEAVRATIAVPGVFTPVERGDALLIDGGVLNNVPADVARSMGGDVIIAVDVHGDGDSVPYPQLGERRLIPAQLAETLDLLYCSLNMMMTEIVRHRLRAARPAVVVLPPIPPEITPLTGFTHAAECIAAGAAAAREAMPAIHAALTAEMARDLR